MSLPCIQPELFYFIYENVKNIGYRYLLTYIAVQFLRQICFSTSAETTVSKNFRFHMNIEIVIKLIYLSLIIFPIFTFLYYNFIVIILTMK